MIILEDVDSNHVLAWRVDSVVKSAVDGKCQLILKGAENKLKMFEYDTPEKLDQAFESVIEMMTENEVITKENVESCVNETTAARENNERN